MSPVVLKYDNLCYAHMLSAVWVCQERSVLFCPNYCGEVVLAVEVAGSGHGNPGQVSTRWLVAS